MNRWLVLFALGAFLVATGYTGTAAAQSPSAGTTVATGAPEAELTDVEKRAKTYAFRGSTVSWWQSLSALAFNPGAELTYNPSYTWTFRIWPKYNFTEKLSLKVKLDINVELTNADDTTKQREAQLGDIWLDLGYGTYKEKTTGLVFGSSLRLILPASKQSQARSMYMGMSPGFSVARSFKLGSVEIEPSYGFRFTKYLNKYTTVQYDAPTIASCSGGSGDCAQFLHTGGRNPSWDFWNFLTLDLGWTKKLRSSIMVAFYNSLLYDLTPAQGLLAGGQRVNVGTSGNDVSSRAALWYYFDLSYQFHPALNIGVGFSTYNAQLADDSTYRTPFFNRFTEVMLNTTVSLDALVALFDRRKIK